VIQKKFIFPTREVAAGSASLSVALSSSSVHLDGRLAATSAKFASRHTSQTSPRELWPYSEDSLQCGQAHPVAYHVMC
jgi:hypothetical protein